MHLSSVRSLSCWNALNFCSLFLQFLVLLLYSSSDMTVQYIKVVTNHDALLTALLDGLNTLTVLWECCWMCAENVPKSTLTRPQGDLDKATYIILYSEVQLGGGGGIMIFGCFGTWKYWTVSFTLLCGKKMCHHWRWWMFECTCSNHYLLCSWSHTVKTFMQLLEMHNTGT